MLNPALSPINRNSKIPKTSHGGKISILFKTPTPKFQFPTMEIARLNPNRINGAQDSQLSKIFLSCSSSTPEVSLPEIIESSFLTSNAFNPRFSTSSCLEMVSFLTMSYTSLKDLLPSTPGISSSNQSWDEIAIKNKLVKKAASAYLQPMSSSCERIHPGFFEWLGIACSFHCRPNSDCVRSCGCLEFVEEMIRDMFGRFFRPNRSRGTVDSDSPPFDN
ncbi:hypothetical protein NE237_024179 [Protea cynaroides]|uniref:Uncharacterized protein n=1 Tax=Protea cynaroides TaxID=273540 RepID=A0A9Q0HGG5_9MAGN|nr:hypothetical protein NE237_024179 [Protea cynaroides]